MSEYGYQNRETRARRHETELRASIDAIRNLPFIAGAESEFSPSTEIRNASELSTAAAIANPETDLAAIGASSLAAIERLVRLRALVDAAIERAVLLARAEKKLRGRSYHDGPATWKEIGDALGVSGQAANAKYGRKR